MTTRNEIDNPMNESKPDNRIRISAKTPALMNLLTEGVGLPDEVVARYVTQSQDGGYSLDIEWPDPNGDPDLIDPESEFVTVADREAMRRANKPKELSRSQLDKIKGECLAKYADRKPKLFLQIDCFGPDAAGDSVIDPDCTGKGMMAGSTWELMCGTPLRILIADDYTDHELLANMITQAAEWVRSDPELLRNHHDRKWSEQETDEGLPF